MENNNAYVVNGHISSFIATIQPREHTEFKLTTEQKTSYRAPVEKENKTGLMEIELTINSDYNDEFNIKLKAEIIVGFDTVPEDFQSFMDDKGIPVAHAYLYERINQILAAMEQPLLNISE